MISLSADHLLITDQLFKTQGLLKTADNLEFFNPKILESEDKMLINNCRLILLFAHVNNKLQFTNIYKSLYICL